MPKRFTITLGRALAVLTLNVAPSLLPAWPVTAGLPDVCGTIADQTERAEGIPEGLVRAVTLAEAGRWLPEDHRTQAWPWTVTAGPTTYYLASKREALRKVRELQASGRSNIDVGCMQVNLGYHGDAFASLDEALDPTSNIAYGARFLKQLAPGDPVLGARDRALPLERSGSRQGVSDQGLSPVAGAAPQLGSPVRRRFASPAAQPMSIPTHPPPVPRRSIA